MYKLTLSVKGEYNEFEIGNENKTSRILNIIAGFFTILYVVGGGDTAPHYIIVALIEVTLAIIIIVTAWRWKEEPQKVIL